MTNNDDLRVKILERLADEMPRTNASLLGMGLDTEDRIGIAKTLNALRQGNAIERIDQPGKLTSYRITAMGLAELVANERPAFARLENAPKRTDAGEGGAAAHADALEDAAEEPAKAAPIVPVARAVLHVGPAGLDLLSALATVEAGGDLSGQTLDDLLRAMPAAVVAAHSRKAWQNMRDRLARDGLIRRDEHLPKTSPRQRRLWITEKGRMAVQVSGRVDVAVVATEEPPANVPWFLQQQPVRESLDGKELAAWIRRAYLNGAHADDTPGMDTESPDALERAQGHCCDGDGDGAGRSEPDGHRALSFSENLRETLARDGRDLELGVESALLDWLDSREDNVGVLLAQGLLTIQEGLSMVRAAAGAASLREDDPA